MVAADFSTAGGADQHHFLLSLMEELLMALEDAGVAGGLLNEHAIAVAVQVHQTLHALGRLEVADHIRILIHSVIPSFPFFICKCKVYF